ncbi:MAG: TPM domain-containing protein [Verrucomicrobiaceae bacterium]|nr:TPM domain-containing protein [Verrucomicrobiaceae bacterium]
MNADEMITHIRDEAVLAAIRDAESRSSGEIRVLITNRSVTDAVRGAWEAFARLKMHQTARRNAALIFIAPTARKFAIIGDEALHQHCTPGFWNHLATELSTGFRTGDYTGALIRVIQQIGDVLATHFPSQPTDHNELPDEIVRE